MAVSEVVAMRYHCDGCHQTYHVAAYPSKPGYQGTVTLTKPNGDQVSAQWWAHTIRCVGNAVRNVLMQAESDAETANEHGV